jgi:hypothetical protein
MTPIVRFHLPALAWAVLLAILLLVPGPQGPAGDWGWFRVPDYSDKAFHALLFGVAAGLFHRSLAAGRGARPALAAAVVLAVLYGAALEGLQAIPGLRRDPDAWDLVANAVGSCLYAGIAMLMVRARFARAAASEPLRPPAALDGKMGES